MLKVGEIYDLFDGNWCWRWRIQITGWAYTHDKKQAFTYNQLDKVTCAVLRAESSAYLHVNYYIWHFEFDIGVIE